MRRAAAPSAAACGAHGAGGAHAGRRLRRAAAALLPLALVAGMALGCASEGDDEADQIKQLQERVLDLQRKAAVSDVELARLRQRLAELTGESQGAPVAPVVSGGSSTAPPAARQQQSPPSYAEPAYPPAAAPPRRQAAQPQPSQPYSQGPQTYQPPPAQQGQQIDVTDIVVPAAPKRANAAPNAAPVESPAGGSPKGEPVTPAVQALYDRGYTLYHQKHYVDAETSFQRFLQAEPHSELADNAQYWIGECRYSRGDMRGALAAFRETVAHYPNGNKTPDAMLKAGMSLEALGDREGARTDYQEILRRFPGTAVAAVAEERRAKIP